MAFSNNFSYLLISTGNKSEMSVGYSTIYGDMNGGFNVLKDVYKTDLYRLARWRNDLKLKFFKGPKGNVIPKNSIIKSPSAELKPDQKDTDSLPPYDILDKILYFIIEEELSVKEIVRKGFKDNVVNKISNLVFKSEYKRRQAPPGVKLSSKSFGKERRYPITNKFKKLMAGTDSSKSIHFQSPIIILKNIQLEENLGMVMRTMLNFGFKNLRLIKPKFDLNGDKVKSSSAGAFDIIKKNYESIQKFRKINRRC